MSNLHSRLQIHRPPQKRINQSLLFPPSFRCTHARASEYEPNRKHLCVSMCVSTYPFLCPILMLYCVMAASKSSSQIPTCAKSHLGLRSVVRSCNCPETTLFFSVIIVLLLRKLSVFSGGSFHIVFMSFFY